jgi:DNA invertase Pin-like site-specific DNA recombinase
MSEKIQPSHIERDAYVHIRQSSMQQVRTRLEGQRRQYDLKERALAFGFQRVVVIDEDLGRSGTGSVERPGFGRLLAAVCSGKVGAVLALEASRLARNNRDWHHLIDLCAMAGTLVIDHDGIYDPSLLNDRLLLGLRDDERVRDQFASTACHGGTPTESRSWFGADPSSHRLRPHRRRRH